MAWLNFWATGFGSCTSLRRHYVREVREVKSFSKISNKVFETAFRLALMSIADGERRGRIQRPQTVLDLTTATCAHIGTLERNHYVRVKKEFKGKKPSTTYSATSEGKRAFVEHLEPLKKSSATFTREHRS